MPAGPFDPGGAFGEDDPLQMPSEPAPAILDGILAEIALLRAAVAALPTAATIAGAVFSFSLFGGEYTFQEAAEKNAVVLWGDCTPANNTVGANLITTNPYTLPGGSVVVFSSTVTRNAANGAILSRTGADGTIP